ncbi:ATP-dependent DNA helicase [Propionibacterium sp.]|uniref:ATP-dependent DNA helicase n=1 Tax=Propionibacterium sp. TaxID=1977903 RepID=UPI0039EB2236
MTANGATSGQRICTAEQLRELLGVPFSEEQIAAITAPMAPGVIIAGAGTGKTTVMAARVVWLVASRAVTPAQVLGLTFTRKAAAELSQRIAQALAKIPEGAEVYSSSDEDWQDVLTYDAFAARLVNDHAPRIGVDPPGRILNEASRFRLASQVVARARGAWDVLSGLSPATLVRRLLDLDSNLAQHLVSIDQLEEFTAAHIVELDAAEPTKQGKPYAKIVAARDQARARIELLGLVEEYRRAKDKIGAVEFADQMALAAQIASDVPQVCAMLREQYKVVLLDEYQDTSTAQALMLSGLFSGSAPEAGRGHAVTAVGDPYQGIYGWRGASAANMAEFPHLFPAADGSAAPAFSLTLNRRSGTAILDAANTLAADLVDDPAMPGGQAGQVALKAADLSKSAEIVAAGFDTDGQELDWIADDILARGGDGGWGQIAVLARRNATLPQLHERLVDREIPVEIVGLGGLLRLEPIREIVSVLRLLDDDTDNSALVQLLRSRRWNLGLDDLEALGDAAKKAATGPRRFRPPAAMDASAEPSEQSPKSTPAASLEELGEQLSRSSVCLMDVLTGSVPGLSAEGTRRLRRCRNRLARLHRLSGRPLRELVSAVVASLGVSAELQADARMVAQDRRRQVSRFLDLVEEFTDLDGTARLDGFLAYLAAESELDDDMEQAMNVASDSVKLLTVHRAKGLEWNTVYLPGLVEGTFPAPNRGDNWLTGPQLLPAPLRGDAGSIPQLREVSNSGIADYATQLRQAARFAEDRLAYVAATRAKSVLVATSHVWTAGLKKPVKQSDYYRRLAEYAAEMGNVRHEPGPPADSNPLGEIPAGVIWPQPDDAEHQELLSSAADAVRAAQVSGEASTVTESASSLEAHRFELTADEESMVRHWATEARRLSQLERVQRRHGSPALPGSLSASAVVESQRNPRAFLETLARPMPRRASVGAGVGTRFHEWLELRFATQRSTLTQDRLDDDPLATEIEGTAHDAEAEVRLAKLKKRFDQGPYADRQPIAVEVPFVLVLGGRQIRGRIDAVYRLDGTDGFDYQVVDWKTYDSAADPLQLALYRQAWAEINSVPPERVDAVFCHVMSGAVERPELLPGEDALVRVTAGLSGLAGTNSEPSSTTHQFRDHLGTDITHQSDINSDDTAQT